MGDERLRVWIDKDLCTGDGICEQLCPSVFIIADDGLAYVIEGSSVNEKNINQVDEAIEKCPGECIFLDSDG